MRSLGAVRVLMRAISEPAYRQFRVMLTLHYRTPFRAGRRECAAARCELPESHPP